MTKRQLFARQEQSASQMRKQRSIGVTADRDAQRITTHDDDTYEPRITAWMARYGVLLTRVALGLVFLWFGALKFLPGMSEAEDVARRTLVKLTFGQVPSPICLYALAAWECA